MSSINRASHRRYLGPIAGQEKTPETFLRMERRIDPNLYTGATGTQCVIPTPDPVAADGEITHPSVVYAPEKWNGYYYWMGVTPYASSIDSYEDPCIFASNDGINWEVPPGLTNPLDDQPGGTKYNSDTHLVFGPDNKLYLFWRFLDTSGDLAGAEENIFLRTSTDGITWTTKQLVHQSDQTVRRLLSPSIEYFDGQWHMFAVEIVGTKRVVHTTSPDLSPSSWSTPVDCTVSLPSGRYPWHLFVTRVGDQWVGLLNDSSNAGNSGQDGDLILMTSDDGTAWEVAAQPCVPRSDTGFTRQYRSCFVPKVVNGVWGFDLWHSVWNPKKVYRTSLTILDYRPESNVEYASLGLGIEPGTRPLRLGGAAPELEFVETDNSDKTWHMGVNGGIWKVTETNVQDKLLLQRADQSYSLRLNDTNTGSSGNYEAFLLNPTINHTGTRGYTGFYVNVTETSAGSGTNRLLRLGVNGSSKFTVYNNGLVEVGNRITNVTDPTSAQDAATKAYADTKGGGGIQTIDLLDAGTDQLLGTTQVPHYTAYFHTGSPVTIDRLTAQCGTFAGSGTVYLGVYSSAYVRLGSGSTTLSASGMFNVTLSSSVTLTPGNLYYFALLNASVNNNGFMAELTDIQTGTAITFQGAASAASLPATETTQNASNRGIWIAGWKA